MNMTPEMFERAKQNMNPELMKQATNMFENMSDDQIKSYAQMTGLGNIDPSFLRNSANMMKNMKEEDMQKFQNMASNSTYADVLNRSRQFQAQPAQQPLEHSLTPQFKQINELKQNGNETFKQQEFANASQLYLEAIMEIEEIWVQNKNMTSTQSLELKQLEISCRSNFCNVKAKQGDFDAVILHALQILKIEENGKACFRLGQAYTEKKQLERAFDYIQKAKRLLPQDEQVSKLFNELQQQVGRKEAPKSQEEIEREKKIQDLKRQLEELEGQQNQNISPSNQEEEKLIQQNPDNQQKKKQKVKLESVDTDSSEFQKLKKSVSEVQQERHQEEPEVIIREEKEDRKQAPQPQPLQRSQSTNVQPTQRFNDPNIQQSMNQFKNMPPDQMKQMVNMMKGMDKSFFKQMMKSQSGMDMSDQQIEMMQNMISPELLQSMSNVDPNMINSMRDMRQADQQPQFVPGVDSSQVNENSPEAPQQNVAQPPTQPSLSSLMQNPDMIKMVLQQLKTNPEMLRSIAGMLGQNHPVSSFIERSSQQIIIIKKNSPEQLKRLVVWMSRLIEFVFALFKVYQLVRRFWYILLGIILAYIFLLR